MVSSPGKPGGGLGPHFSSKVWGAGRKQLSLREAGPDNSFQASVLVMSFIVFTTNPSNHVFLCCPPVHIASHLQLHSSSFFQPVPCQVPITEQVLSP